MVAGFPVFDVQFIVVTIAFVIALWFVVRLFIPRHRKSGGGFCTGCETGPVTKLASGRGKTSLTINGQRV